jgi:hypothetical protein
MHAHLAARQGTDNITLRFSTGSAALPQGSRADADAQKRECDVLAVFKNGPRSRYWMYDWIVLPIGTQRDFNGLLVRWLAHVQLPTAFGKTGSTVYKGYTQHFCKYALQHISAPIFHRPSYGAE